MTNLPNLRELPRILLSVLFIAAAIIASLWVLQPFLPALIWATLIVVATWPLMRAAQKRLWGKRRERTLFNLSIVCSGGRSSSQRARMLAWNAHMRRAVGYPFPATSPSAMAYRPAGSSTVRFAQPSCVDSCSRSESIGTSTKSGVLIPAHALAPSRLALISTEPVGCV